MKIIFEPTEEFKANPGFYRHIAEEHLLGRTFDSVDDALKLNLDTKGESGCIGYYFRKSSSDPSRVDSRIPFSDYSGSYSISSLRARFEDSS